MKKLLTFCLVTCIVMFASMGFVLKAQNPCEPTNQAATEITAHTAVLSWEGLTGFTKVRYYPAGTTAYKIRGAHLNNTVTLTLLAPNTTYVWELSTFCNGVWTPFGWPQTFTTLESTIVCEPTNQLSTDVTAHTAVLSWEGLTGTTKVRYYPTGSTEYKYRSAFMNNSTTLYGLLAETEYTWELSTFCDGVWTPFGWPQTFTTLEDNVVCEPANQIASDITWNTAVLSWEGLTGYTRVRYYPTGTTNYKIRAAFLNNTVTLYHLIPETEYTWEISTFCNGMWTAYGWPQTFTTLVSNLVCEPSNQAFSNLTATGAVLSWEGTNVPVKVRYYPSGTTNYKFKAACLNNTVTLVNLMPETEYTWELSIFCNGGWSEFGWPQTFTTLPENGKADGQNAQQLSEFESNKTRISEAFVYPNPITRQTTLNFEAAESTTYYLRISNLIGDVIYEYKGLSTLGQNTLQLDLGKEKSGVYLLMIQTGNDIIKTKLIKE